MKKGVIIIILLISFLSCENDDNALNQVANTEFVFPLVSSEDECNLSLSQGVNCAQSVIFENNANVQVIITDIANEGIYIINDKTIIITFLSSGDAENPMTFEANDDFTELTRVSNESNDVWKLQVKGVNPWDL